MNIITEFEKYWSGNSRVTAVFSVCFKQIQCVCAELRRGRERYCGKIITRNILKKRTPFFGAVNLVLNFEL